jgi:hypothetical protein
MQVETCQTGRPLRLGDIIQIVIRHREKGRLCVDEPMPAGMVVCLNDACARRIPERIRVHTHFFSLHALRRCGLGRFEARIENHGRRLLIGGA